MPPNIAELQFMLEATTGLASGQNSKNKSGVKNSSAAMLIGSPNRPKDHLRGGRGSPYNLRHTRQPIVSIYEQRMATPPSELIAFKAVVEPRLMQARRDVITRDVSTARIGMFQPGATDRPIS